VMMDTYRQAAPSKRQYRSLEEKLRIVQEALAEGASVARVARAHGVNANLVFNWCRLYRAGRLRRRSEAALLPVRLEAESSTLAAPSTAEPVRLLATAASTIPGLAVPVVDELAALPLDLWARENGYQKLQMNAVGM
jgi:transposase